MNETWVLNLVRNTFENSFDRERFLNFAKNLFKTFDESKAFHARGHVKDKFKKITPVIKTYERLGTFTDPENNKIDILIVYLEKDDSLDRARTTQRNFVGDYLKDRDAKDAALVAFVPPSMNDWRLSLVKMDYHLGESKAGKIKTITEFTPARRFSFLVGANENTHTAQRQFLPILKDTDFKPALSDLESAFSVEVVTKDFFEKYKKLFLDTKEALDAMVAKDAKIKTDFEEKNIDTADFAKKLLGQIVFLYFLQKKGWFGVARDAVWGTGPKDFLRRLFEKAIAPYDNFFNDTLEPLFYEALAVERTDDFYSKFNCKIPFLNGGLFDPLGNYDWVHTDICLPNELFSNNRKTKEGDTGDGILDVFDRYNFTVKEDEPLEREVAVDPEMLGKVFENLLEVKDRKSKGTYYTPREIVHYMCQESLINYLLTELEGKVERDDIETLIRLGETAIEHDKVVLEHGEEKGRYTFKLPQSIRDNAHLLDEKLEKIHVCDPAVGSGAFLVGMMTEVIRVRSVLTNYLSDNGRSIYDFKRHAIQNSLYGVDIDPGAVEIAKLRLWLSLIVDEQDIKQIKPLPNLDYKIMQGNSLLEEYEGIKLFDEGIVSASPLDNTKQIEEIKQKLSELQREFFRLLSAGKLKSTKKQQIELEVKKYDGWFKKLTKPPKVKADNGSLFDQDSAAKQKSDELKKLHQEFFEMANKREKDEIKKKIEVLEWELIEATLREKNKISLLPEIERFKKANIKPFFLWKLNFSEVFEQNGGFDVVIANPPYEEISEKSLKDTFKTIYSDVLSGHYDLYIFFIKRGFDLLCKGGSLSFIVPHTYLHYPQFFNLRKWIYENAQVIELTQPIHNIFQAVVDNSILFVKNTLPQADSQTRFTTISFNFNSINSVESDSLKHNEFSDQTFDFEGIQNLIKLEKFSPGTILLGDIVESSQGITVYAKVQGAKVNYFRDAPENKYSKPFAKGKEIFKYSLEWSGSYIQYGDWLWCPRNPKFFEKEKIFLRQTADQLVATYVKEPMYCIDSVHSLINKEGAEFDLKFILAVLNSKLGNYFYQLLNFEKGKVFAQVKLTFLRKLPIKRLSPQEQKPFIEYVDKILTPKNSKSQENESNTQTCIEQLDQLIYKLYGLTPEEIAIIEG